MVSFARWQRFSLRTTLIAVLLISLPCAWIARLSHEAAKRNAAIASLGAAYTRNVFTRPYFGRFRSLESTHLVEAQLHEPSREKISRALANLTVFSELKHLNLTSSGITDDELAICNRFPELSVLKLRGTSIADAGVKHLSTLSSLRYLDLSETLITDRAAEVLADMAGLVALHMADTKITDKTANVFASKSRIQYLDVSNTTLSLEGLERLAEMPSLKRILVHGIPCLLNYPIKNYCTESHPFVEKYRQRLGGPWPSTRDFETRG
jgi:hypothetical protein